MIAGGFSSLMSSALTLLSLPLFPLNTVLFPGGQLPLRIFEVRYLDMIGKCHKADAPFGVVSLVQGSEIRQPGATERFAEIGTLASITELVQVQAGLLSVRCRGSQRFRVLGTQTLKNGLWVADVQRVDDDAHVSVPADLRATATALERLLDTLRERAPADAPTERRLNDCGWVANRWCEVLPLPITVKQQLMALENPLVRLELVDDFLARSQIAH